jgi:hypothetical protein
MPTATEPRIKMQEKYAHHTRRTLDTINRISTYYYYYYYYNRSTYVVGIRQARRAFCTRAAAVNNKIIFKK